MDTEKCKVLLITIETGSFSAAAEKLSYTPSGISRMIASLEAETGFPLLTRGRLGVVPTTDCIKMLPVFRELTRWGEQYNQLSSEISGLKTGRVIVGTSYSVYYRWLSRLIASFREIYPNIEVDILEGYSSELCQAMEECRADLCIISRREGSFTWIPLMEDPLVAWVPSNHPLASSKAFPISSYATEPFISTYSGHDTDSARTLARNNIKPNTLFTTSDSFATYYMVEAGLGVGLNNSLNSKDLNGAVTVLPLDPPQKVEIGIAIQSSMSPAAKRFIEFAKAHVSEL
jgi:DNA-binding transcriptional LysR family regulator